MVVVSGPSGAGKDALLARIQERGEPFAFPLTMTTRAPREGEADGVDYRFVTEQEFRRRVDSGEMLEHALVYGRPYGVPRSQLREPLAAGRDVLMHVDVQGAATLRELLPGALLLFIVPDDLGQIERRMREREMDPAEIERRLEIAQRELAQRERFDYVVENVDGDLEGTVDRVLEIVDGERRRPGRQPVTL